MTKGERIKARLEDCEKIFSHLNEILDEWYRKEKNHLETIAIINGYLEITGRRKKGVMQ